MYGICGQEEFPVHEYFVPLTVHSDAGTLDNEREFKNLYCSSNTNGRNKHDPCCTKGRTKNKGAQDDELGMSMAMRLRDKIISGFRDPGRRKESTKLEVPNLPNDCCNHEEPIGRQKFVVSFGVNSVSLSDECAAAEQSRCESFWKFVDSQPEFREMMKEGEFEQESKPPKIVMEPSKTRIRKADPDCKEGEILRAKHRAIYAADRERMLRRKMQTMELQIKSGQPVVHVAKLPSSRERSMSSIVVGASVTGSHADSVSENVGEILRDMRKFDRKSRNLVRDGPRSPGESPSPLSTPDPEEYEFLGEYADDEEEEY